MKPNGVVISILIVTLKRFAVFLSLPSFSPGPAKKYAADIKVKFPKTYALLAKNITLECFALGK